MQNEYNANLNKLNMMLSEIEQMESEMRVTKRLFMKTKGSAGRRWKRYYAKIQKK